MNILFFVFIPLVWTSIVNGFDCPELEDDNFDFKDPSFPEIFFRCFTSMGTKIVSWRCPPGTTFDMESKECQSDSKLRSFGNEMYREKRSADSDIMVHSIPKKDIEESISNFMNIFKSVTNNYFQNVSSLAYEHLEFHYFPIFELIKKDVIPIYINKVLPKAQKFREYIQSLSGRIFKKIYWSWEASNSSHINLVSFQDVISDVSEDLNTFFEFERNLSSTTMPSKRSKRTVDNSDSLPDFILEYVRPVVKSLFANTINFVVGGEESLMSKLFLPSVIEIFEDPETKFYLRRIFWSAKSAYAPFVLEMLKKQSYNTPRGTIIRMPYAIIQKAVHQFNTETEPLIRKVLIKHLPSFLRRSAKFTPLIFETLETVRRHAGNDVSKLKTSIFSFVMKYSEVSERSGSNYWNLYTYTEMINDLKPIKQDLVNIIFNYMSRSPDSFLNILFRADSIFTRLL
ncbi:chitin-binding type-2 domain-containing protein [Nephila pilipes]|uniref:Chitin-binding type-2 domain-containing protein n=1 Tax=Nephila pilipes TaxID=299642 RepID=A0A8X6TM28_NEPPI|nr:chitin-binding type-2 domain-containing protein [Nephila pilipes]